MSNQPLATVKIYRSQPGEEKGEFQTYQIPYFPGMTLLDGLIWLRENVDPTIAIRYSCRNANACKTCAVKVNGKNAYTCTVRLGDEPLVVEPSSPKTQLRDIVSTMG